MPHDQLAAIFGIMKNERGVGKRQSMADFGAVVCLRESITPRAPDVLEGRGPRQFLGTGQYHERSRSGGIFAVVSA